MSRNGSGTYSLPAGNPVVTGTTISSTWANNTLSDIATALTQSIAYDGQTTPTANLPMGGFKHTGVAVGAALTDYARYDQLQNSSPQWLTSVTGTDTITASAPVTPSAYAGGQTFRFVAAGANTGAVTLNVSSLGAKSITKNGSTALSAGDIPNGAVIVVTYDGTQFQLINVKNISVPTGIAKGNGATFSAATDGTDYISPAYAHSCNGFRLTLTTGVPVTTSDVIGATTVYCTPYKGNEIALYTGSAWVVRSSAEFSLALGTLSSGKPYDVFCYDNSGTPTLEFLVWTNDTTRATALAYQDGVLVKSGAATRRYLGTFYTTAATTTEDSAAKRYLWNYYHRCVRIMRKADATASWTYTSTTPRQANNSAANQIEFVIGVSEDSVKAEVNANYSNSSAGVGGIVQMGLNGTTALTGNVTSGSIFNPTAGGSTQSRVAYSSYLLGRNYLTWLESVSSATGTQTWYGSTVPFFSAITGEVLA